MIGRTVAPLAGSWVLAWAMLATAQGPVDVQARPIEAIPPGTVIGEGSTRGWTDLILFARPRLGVGDVADAPELVASYSKMFCLTILAKVRGEARDGYRLDKVAIGLAVNTEGKDVATDSENNAGADLGLIGRRVLAENERILKEDARQVARTPTMLVLDHTAFVRRGGEHRSMVVRYAILASPRTGKVSTFVWLLGSGSGGGYALAEKGLQKLPPGYREDRVLSVDANKFTFGIPSTDAFALDRLPQGIALGFSDVFKSVGATRTFTAESARKLEAELAARYVPVVAKPKAATQTRR
jgi:hypothetical protein